jgi:hypothetical protein
MQHNHCYTDWTRISLGQYNPGRPPLTGPRLHLYADNSQPPSHHTGPGGACQEISRPDSARKKSGMGIPLIKIIRDLPQHYIKKKRIPLLFLD